MSTAATVTAPPVAGGPVAAGPVIAGPVVPVPVPVPPPSAYPTPVTVPVSPKGDPVAARTLAAAYRQLADTLDTTATQLDHLTTDLTQRWHGTGAHTLHTATTTLQHNLTTLAHAARDTANHLEDYATALHKAQHHHGWSLGKIIAVGALVAITTTAVIITVGTAAPIGTLAAAEVGEAIAGAEAAAAGATAAETTATTALTLTTQTLTTTLRTLTTALLPHLTNGAINVAFDLTLHTITGHGVNGTDLADSFATGFATSATTTATRTALHATQTYQHLATAGQAALDTTALATTLTTDDALTQYATTGHLNPTQLTETALLVATTGALTTLRHPTQDTGAIAGGQPGAPTGQTIAGLVTDGVQLDEHEGPFPLGHTLQKHVGQTKEELEQRLVAEPKLRAVSTFPDKATAEAAITDALRKRPDVLAKVAATPGSFDSFTVDVGWVVGTVMRANHQIVSSQIVVVKIVNVGGKVVVRTAFVGTP